MNDTNSNNDEDLDDDVGDVKDMKNNKLKRRGNIPQTMISNEEEDLCNTNENKAQDKHNYLNNEEKEDDEEEDDENDDDDDMESDFEVDGEEGDIDDASEGSFPTTRDLASLAGSSRPPESVSYLGISISGGGSFGGGGSIGGGGSSAGGMSETKSLTGQRSLSFCSDVERPVGGVMISHTSIGLSHETVGPCFSLSETAKSDIATVCSNSVMEDIASDVASVGTIHSAATTTIAQYSHLNISADNKVTGSSSSNKKKFEKRLEFSSETSTVWKYSNHVHNANPMRSSPLQAPLTSPGGNSITMLNDMGPPLNRSLLEKVRGIGGGPSSTGTPSRAGSVKSFGSQAASEVVHVDTDDCGGSIAEFSGIDENPSFHSSDNMGKTLQDDSTEVMGIEMRITSGDTLRHNAPNDAYIMVSEKQVVSLDKLAESNQYGRISPGGTVYKGRGVRKYQSRYMHLPLKRFQQNGATIPEPLSDDANDWQPHRSWRSDGDEKCSRSRSRSRSRDREDNDERWNKNNSRSPPGRELRGNHNNRPSNGGGRWRQSRRYESSSQRHKSSNGSRRGGWNGNNNNNNKGSVKMTPRDPRHRDFKK